MPVDPRVVVFVLGAIVSSACKRETAEPATEPGAAAVASVALPGFQSTG